MTNQTSKPVKDFKIEDILITNQTAQIDPNLPLRATLYAWLFNPNIEGNYQKSFDRWIALLIILNIFAIFLEDIPAIHQPYKNLFLIFDLFSIVIFSIEYLLRLYLAPEDEEFNNTTHPRLSFIKSPFALIDLLAIAPFFLQAFIPIDLRMLRFLRLLRIFKIFRVLIPAYIQFIELNQHRSFRQKIHALVFPSSFGGKLHEIFDTFIAIWVIISVFAVILETVGSIHFTFHLHFIVLDTIAVAIFSLEYCMRMYSCVEEPGFRHPILGRMKHGKQFSSIVDLLSILPFFIEVFLHHIVDLRFLRVFRLLRLLKLTRYSGATSTLRKVIAREWPVLCASIFIMLLLVILTSCLGYFFEHEAQPDKYENIPQSIYWAVITLASVGYGDISPITPMGRFTTMILALLGIGIFAIPAALLSSAFSDQLHKEREEMKREIYKILQDDMINHHEAQFIRDEAKRLHLTHHEINDIIHEIQHESQLPQAELPIHQIAKNTEYALEHYKILLAQLRQLGLLTNQAEFSKLAADRLTPSEKALWEKINQSSN